MEADLYSQALDQVLIEAKEASDSAADVDISIFRGRGPAFVLEFTAIVVIIFSALILGVLEKLGSDQIGTLLAAIAGYVLGRSKDQSGEGNRTLRQEKESKPSPDLAAQSAIAGYVLGRSKDQSGEGNRKSKQEKAEKETQHPQT